jgi:hypothetical protein
VVPQLVSWVTTHLPCGSGALSATAVQKPAVVARLQAMHAPVHAFSQHTPWAQNPDWHLVPTLQLCPLGSRPQEESVQTLPGAHWMLLLVQLL